MTTITEDLVLLLLDPDSGRPVVDGTALDHAIGGALLLDLSLRDRIAADGDGAKARLTVDDPAPTGDALLDSALDRLAGKPLRAQRAVERLTRKYRERVLDRLVQRGIVERRVQKRMGLFPSTYWPAVDNGPGRELRAALARVLRDGGEPDERTACLVSLVHAVKAEHKLVDGPRRKLRARAAEVTRGEWAGAAVRRAVQAVQVSVAVALSAAASAGTAGSS